MRKIHRKDNRKNKIIIISILFISLLGLVTGYSVFNTKLSINTKGNLKETITPEKLKTLVVTSGDGLYQDSVEPEKYFYRGKNPQNFIKISNDLYRIININDDDSIRIIKNDSIGNFKFDTMADRYQANGFCNNYDYGCKIWSSSSTTYNQSNILITKMPLAKNETEYDLPIDVASLNSYLNNTWYDTFEDKKIVKNAMYNIGHVSFDESKTLKDSIKESESYKWKGNVGLIEITDYIRTNTNNNCNTMYLNTNLSETYNSCINTTWLYNGLWQWTINIGDMKNQYVWSIGTSGDIGLIYPIEEKAVRPILTLNSDIKLKGIGTHDQPYELSGN